MSQKSTEDLRERWDERAKRYDEWYWTFKGAVEHFVDWELLKGYLPESRNAKILDAAGGTGRITLPLAKMGYSVTLCDISPEMLNVARQKLIHGGLLDKVGTLECDVRKLPFPDDCFDFLICWDGGIEAAKELVRVIKKGGRISIFLVNRCGSAIHRFGEDPEAALTLLRSKSSYVYDEGEKYLSVSAEEAEEFFRKEGIRVLDVYAVCSMLDWLSIPQEIQESCSWDAKFFEQVTEMLLRLSKEPSVKGLSRHLVLYGEKM